MLGRELRALLALAIPVILSELGWVAMGIVDTIMVGRLGPEAIGAVGISSASYYAPALFGIGILLGLDTVVSQAWGRRDFEVCHQWLAQGFYLVVSYTPFAMLGIAAVPLLFSPLRHQSRRRRPCGRIPAHTESRYAAAAHLRCISPLSAGCRPRASRHLRARLCQPHQLGRELGAHLRASWICRRWG